MKAISIQQPWASLIAEGFKTIETRTWQTCYRGPLLIVSTKRPKVNDLPLGMALAICALVDCKPAEPAYEVQEKAKAFCDVAGRMLWFLDCVQKIKPFPMKGQQGLYPVPDEIAQQIRTK